MAAAAAEAQRAKAVAALVDVPGARLAELSSAYDAVQIPVLTRAWRGEGSDGSTGPPFKKVEAAMGAALADIKPRTVAVVAGAEVAPAAVADFEANLKRLRVGTVKVFRDGGDNISEVAAVHPDLVISLGDARSLEALAMRMKSAQMTAALLAGPAVGTVPDGPLTELARQGRLWSVTPYRPTGDLAQEQFLASYGRVFGSAEHPGYGAAQGYQMLEGLLARLDQADTEWTAARVRAAVESGTAVMATTFSGTSVGAARPGPARWAIMRYQNGSPSTVREVSP